MNILWLSDDPTLPTGYGTVTSFVCRGLAAAGHRVSILGRGLGLGASTTDQPRAWHGCTLYPLPTVGEARDGRREYIIEVARREKPDVLIALTEVSWIAKLPPHVLKNFRRGLGVPWMLYHPISGDLGDCRLPMPWLEVMRAADLSIAMCEYGRTISDANGIPGAMIPHGVDLQTFAPPADKAAAKRAQGWEDRFVVLSDARNQVRKMLPRTLEIFRRFAADKPDALLHLHTDPDDPWARTWKYHYDIRADIALLDLGDRVRLTDGMSMADGGVSRTQLAALYQGADVHLLASLDEGFGLPTLQAAATGVVPLAGDFTASAELVRGHGEALRIRHYLRDDLGMRHGLVDIDDAVEKLNALYHDRTRLRLKAEQARRFAEQYGWERVVSQWEALLVSQVPALTAGARPAAAMRMPDTDPIVPRGLLTIPVTLPAEGAFGETMRVTGRVYVAGPADVAVLVQLARVFPSVTGWTTRPLGEWIRQVDPASYEYRQSLATSTLALDSEGLDATLPADAADAGVPCMARRGELQDALWPALALTSSDARVIARLARALITDEGDAAAACDEARRRRASTPTAVTASAE